MTYLSGSRAIHPDSRLFEPLLTIFASFDAIHIATSVCEWHSKPESKTQVAGFGPSGNIGVQTSLGVWVNFPAVKLTELITKNIKPTGFEVVFSL